VKLQVVFQIKFAKWKMAKAAQFATMPLAKSVYRTSALTIRSTKSTTKQMYAGDLFRSKSLFTYPLPCSYLVVFQALFVAYAAARAVQSVGNTTIT